MMQLIGMVFDNVFKWAVTIQPDSMIALAEIHSHSDPNISRLNAA